MPLCGSVTVARSSTRPRRCSRRTVRTASPSMCWPTRADVSRRTVFNHFATIDDVVIAVCSEILGDDRRAIRTACRDETSERRHRPGAAAVFDELADAVPLDRPRQPRWPTSPSARPQPTTEPTQPGRRCCCCAPSPTSANDCPPTSCRRHDAADALHRAPARRLADERARRPAPALVRSRPAAPTTRRSRESGTTCSTSSSSTTATAYGPTAPSAHDLLTPRRPTPLASHERLLMAEFLYRLGQTASRARTPVVAAWFAVLIAAGIALRRRRRHADQHGVDPWHPDRPGHRPAAAPCSPRPRVGTGRSCFQTRTARRSPRSSGSAISERGAEAARVDGRRDRRRPLRNRAAIAHAQQRGARDGARGSRTVAGSSRRAATQLEDGPGPARRGRATRPRQTGTLDELGDHARQRSRASLDAAGWPSRTRASRTSTPAPSRSTQGERLLDLSSRACGMVSEDGTTAIATVRLRRAADGRHPGARRTRSSPSSRPHRRRGRRLLLGGDRQRHPEHPRGRRGHRPVVAAVVLVVMLGTLIGAGLPILTALIGVGIGALSRCPSPASSRWPP